MAGKKKISKNFDAKSLYNYLNERIVGQHDAKKLTSIAFVSHFLRQSVKDHELRNSIIPKNMLFYGPTGVGKTEIARSLASYSDMPFIKVDITNFTEVGYAGSDVDTIVKDLVSQEIQKDLSSANEVNLIKNRNKVAKKVALAYIKFKKDEFNYDSLSQDEKDSLLEKFKKDILSQTLDSAQIEVDKSDFEENDRQVFIQHIDFQYNEENLEMIPMLQMKVNNGKKKVKSTVGNLFASMLRSEIAKSVNHEKLISDVLKKIEDGAIIFIDEIDKIISPANSSLKDKGSVSREGVQRGLLSIIEGTNVSTRYGVVNTKNILFIAAGAFSEVKPTDLMPELQGRFPVKVKLNSLTVEDFIQISSKIKFNLVEQYKALAESLNIDLIFTEDGIKKIAELSVAMNFNLYDMGARRLHSIFEKILEDVFFVDKTKSINVVEVNADFVLREMSSLLKKDNIDVNKFLL